MKKKLILSTLFVLIIILISACNSNSYENISVEDAKSMMDENPEKVILLDVRTEEEFLGGHAKTAVLSPVESLEKAVESLDPEKSYLVICRSGNRSVTASNILVNQGFKKVFNVEGGMNIWPYEIVVGQ